MENFNIFERISGKEIRFFFFRIDSIKEEFSLPLEEKKSRVFILVIAISPSFPFSYARLLRKCWCKRHQWRGSGNRVSDESFRFRRGTAVRGDSWYEPGRKSACKQIREPSVRKSVDETELRARRRVWSGRVGIMVGHFSKKDETRCPRQRAS